ncbi:MAG TPA: ATP-binding protein [Candidatus Saccharimonadales bacterium]|nr:ATP-binding protein [Candidatus Saccharimonadales bacterium]
MSRPVISWLSYVITLVGLFIILAIVAAKNYRTRINRGFILFGLFVALYVGASFVPEFTNSYQLELIWTRTALMVANFIPVFFYVFTKALVNKRLVNKYVEYSIYLAPFVLAPIAYLPSNISTIVPSPYGINLGKLGPLLWITLVYFLIVFAICFIGLFRYSKVADKTAKLQINIISMSIGLTVGINLVTQLVLPEFHISNLGNLVGNPSDIILVGGISYAILRHKLFDIRSVVLRSIGYIIMLGVAAFIYSFVILGASKAIFTNLHLTFLEDVYFVLASLLITFSFPTFSRLISKTTDRLFYRDHYNSEDLINQIGRLLASEIKLESLSQRVIEIICREMKIKMVDIIVLDKGHVYYDAKQIFTVSLPEFTLDMERQGYSTVVTDELPENEQKATLRGYGISVFSVLKTRDEKVGYMLFSDKRSGTLYNNNDVRVINIMADELAIAIQNSRSYSQITEFNVTLQSRVEEATQKLRQANEQLKETNATKDDFISMASHQLSTPLAVMDGYLSLITKGIYGQADSKINHALEVALSRTRMMKSLVFDLLNLSRMTAGKFFLELADADMNQIVTDQISQLKTQAEEKKVIVTYRPPDIPVPTIRVDIQKTTQAVMNLINNAIFYAPNGKVDIYLTAEGPNVVFKVTDNGIGVPDEEKPKLFTKFFRADNAKKESPNGTGIGLYLVKRVVEDQKGEIIFSSQLGHGSTFGFKLPVVSAVPSPAPLK